MRFDRNAFCWWNFEISTQEFPKRLVEFFQTLPSGPLTHSTEELGEQMIARGFQHEELNNFIVAVCNWGNYPGIAARVIQNNHPDDLAALFRQAYREADKGTVTEALATLQRVNEFGISFASKHLKFLAPNKAVVLDSIIETRLGYARNLAGYENFLTNCHLILAELQTHNIEYPGWGAKGWRVSDVEMAIFAKLTARRAE
jgi:Putative 8-oxoguanine DNA glycosylase OGG-like protein